MTTEREKLVLDYLNLARKIAGRYRNVGIDYEDLVSIAFLGLVKAANSYNQEKAKFVSYAIPAIQNEILMNLRKKAIMGVSFDEQEGDGMKLGDLIGSESKELEQLENRLFLGQCMRTLTENEQVVLNEIYYQNKVQSEVAKQLGCSQGHVSRIHHAALSKLRRACCR